MKNSDIELCLISAVIISGDMKTAIKKGITTDIFGHEEESWKWLSDQYLKNGKVPSEVMYESRFPSAELLETDEVEYWSEALVKSYRRRRLTGSIRDAITIVEDGGDPEIAAAEISKSWREAVITSTSKDDETEIIGSWKSSFDEAIERKKIVKEHGLAGVTTSFPSIDDATGGLQPQWFCVVGGRLGAGKTMTMLRMAWEAVWTGKRVLFLSLEQSTSQISYRIHSFGSAAVMKNKRERINSLDLVKGTGFDSGRYRDVLKAIESNTTGKLWVYDPSRGRINTDTLSQLVSDKQPDIVFVDYITLMGTAGSQKMETWQKVAQISAELKAIASQHQIPVVAGSQLNRGGVGTAPGNENISGSDAVGHDADLIILVSNHQSENVKRLHISKFRHGPDGITIYADYQPAIGVYSEVTYNKAEELIEQSKMVE